MKRSTCRYFQRENECAAAGSRRAATPPAAAPAVRDAERQRHRRHGHAVRIVGVHDLGPVRRAMICDSRQAEARSTSERGAAAPDRRPRWPAGTARPPDGRRARPDGRARAVPSTVRRTWCCPPRQVRAVSRWSEQRHAPTAWRTCSGPRRWRSGSRDDEARALPSRIAAAQDVVAQERRRRMHGQVEPAGAPAVLAHLPRPPASCSDPWSAGGATGRDRRGARSSLRSSATGPSARTDSWTWRPSSGRGGDRRAAAGSPGTSRSLRIHRPRWKVTRGTR